MTLLRYLYLCIAFIVMLPAAHAVERIEHYHYDALGSVVAITDANGHLVYREEYQPYGNRLLKQDGGKERLWYTGKPEESQVGL